MTDARTATLTALINWAGTSRADLVAACWNAGNRNVTELAQAAGVGRDAIYSDLRSKHIDPHTDRKKPPMTTITNEWTVLPIPGWRHPHLLEVASRKTYFGIEYKSDFKPFTGHEPRPKIPAEWNDTHSTDADYRAWDQRTRETRLAVAIWARAHFTVLLEEQLRCPVDYGKTSAADMWTAYTTARQALTDAYAALDTTPDNEWRAALLRIVDAKEIAETAAKQWDRAGETFATLNNWLLDEIGEEAWTSHELQDDAAKLGVDATDWLIGSSDDYDHRGIFGPPATHEIEKIVEEGDRRIKAVQDLLNN